MTLSRRSLLIACSVSLLTTGCGYQLRGFNHTLQGEMGSKLSYKRIYIQTENTDSKIVKGLAQFIQAVGSERVDHPDKAELEIILGESQWTQVTSAIGYYGEVAARLVILNQNIQVRQMGSDRWLIDTQVRRSREVDQASSLIAGLGAGRPLAIARESDEVTQDVRQRVVEALIRLIQQLAPIETKS